MGTKRTTDSLRVDATSSLLMASAPLASAQLHDLKAQLDDVSKRLKTGKATAVDKESAKVLTKTLTKALETRAIAEKATKATSAGLTKAILEDKSKLDALMKNLKDTVSTKDKEIVKESILRVKSRLTDSLKVQETRQFLAQKTAAKNTVTMQIDKNLQMARQGRNVAVCFMVDCTASMHPYIRAVQNQVRETVAQYTKMYADASLMYAFVGYRDFDDDQFFVKPFTASVDEFVSFVEGVGANGGADCCEDVAGGLRETLKLDWNCVGDGSSRILVHIADAPAHGSQYNGGCSDSYADCATPNGESKDVTPFLMALRAQKVHYFFYKINDCTDAMVNRFNADVGKPYVTINELGDVRKLSDTVLKTFTTTVKRTAVATRTLHAKALGKDHKGLSTVPEDDKDWLGSGI